MKTTATAINFLYAVLKAEGTGITEPVFMYSKPGAVKLNQYVVLNSLPVNADIMQSCIVNVNYHVKDKAEGVPDIEKLEAGTSSIIGLLHEKDEFGEEINIHVELDESLAQQIVRDEAIKEHYSNIRFKVKIINKQ